jgi:hypothetical protein
LIGLAGLLARMSYDFVPFGPEGGVDPRAIVYGDSIEAGARVATDQKFSMEVLATDHVSAR